jgi:hypothetical protein
VLKAQFDAIDVLKYRPTFEDAAGYALVGAGLAPVVPIPPPSPRPTGRRWRAAGCARCSGRAARRPHGVGKGPCVAWLGTRGARQRRVGHFKRHSASVAQVTTSGRARLNRPVASARNGPTTAGELAPRRQSFDPAKG